MPEGDTIHRAARTLHRALAGRAVTRFESVFPALTRVDVDTPLRGRTIERVEARGKHLLMWFSGLPTVLSAVAPAGAEAEASAKAERLVLRTHMRMSGSWHIYRPHERWQRRRDDMRIIVETDELHAVAFNVPVAEMTTPEALQRSHPISSLGPDPLSADFRANEAAARLLSRTGMDIADAVLDQSAIAGIGNVYKSEILFAGRINPFAKVDELTATDVERLVAIAVKFMRANAAEGTPAAIETYRGLRRTTGRHDPGARLWVYGRAGKPCRRCGTLIARSRQGPHARSTYWCTQCQDRTLNQNAEPRTEPEHEPRT